MWEAMRADGVAANTVTYSALVAVCAGSGKWQEALQLVAAMKEEGVQPNTITYNSLISACGKAAQLDQAMDTLATMQVRIVVDWVAVAYWH